MNCWLGEADKRERRAMQKKIAYRDDKKKENEKCEEKVTASRKPTNRSDVSTLNMHHRPIITIPWRSCEP